MASIDAARAVQRAFLDALSVPGVTAQAPVLQHVRENTHPPFVRVGAIELTPEGGKDGGLDRATVEVLSDIREPKRAALYAIMAAVRSAVEGAALTADGFAMTPPVFEGQSDDLLEDGQTYEGTQIFSLWVQSQ